MGLSTPFEFQLYVSRLWCDFDIVLLCAQINSRRSIHCILSMRFIKDDINIFKTITFFY